MNLRGAVLIAAWLGIPAALLVLVLPMTWGYGGYRWRTVQYGSQYGMGAVTYLDPSGPGARAGLRPGDLLRFHLSAQTLINDIAGPVGTVDRLQVVRNGRVREIDVTFAPYSGVLGTQQLLSKVLNAVTALCAFVVTILVLLRGRNRDLASRAAYVLLFAGLRALSQGLSLVVYYADGAAICATMLPPLLLSLTLWAALAMLAVFPREGGSFRRLLERAGVAGVVLMAVVVAVGAATTLGLRIPDMPLNPPLSLILILTAAVSIAHAMTRAKDAEVVPMRWLGTMWLMALAVQAVPFALTVGKMSIGTSHYFDLAEALFVFLLTFGAAYPILRHRLIDMNIFVSRATVFTIVSLIIVCIFVGAEWAIGKIFEHSLGFANDRGGLAAQAATLAVVLLLGISARSIHGFVEDRLSKIFFRSRFEAVRDIERVAHETDAATDAPSVLTLAVETVHRSLQTSGTAVYLRDGDRYICARMAGDAAFAPRYDFNDPVPLRLRRWQQPFETQSDTADAHHLLFLPMTLRGEVLGFLVCGPKSDHTAYLSDEIAAISLLAHHAGIASAWLSRPASLPELHFTTGL